MSRVTICGGSRFRISFQSSPLRADLDRRRKESSAHLASSSDQLPYVFLESRPGGAMVKQPLPSFGDADRVVNQLGAR